MRPFIRFTPRFSRFFSGLLLAAVCGLFWPFAPAAQTRYNEDFSTTTEKSSDLEAYIQEIRSSGVSEMGQSHIRSIAGILAGSTILSYRVDSTSGRFWPGYMSATCPRPDADTPELERWKALQMSESEKLAIKLMPIADRDASGFVTTKEAWSFRTLIEFGYLVSQVISESDATIEAVSRASGMDIESARHRLKEYQSLSQRLLDIGVADLPNTDFSK